MSTATEEVLSPAEVEEFRTKVRTFLQENAVGIDGAGRGSTSIHAGRAFQAKLAEAGLAGLVYPKELGGAGLTRAHERIYREEYAKFPDMTYELVISHGMCLPVLNQFGTE
ncbi:MAG: acyl-CoA dehydrogenase family protein, partial [Ilumatobacteraceae bacterium]